ncbi:MAG: hypothetical protein JNL70_12855 [Saprospiraceae bacterium]|nr:hypothetical protein [Saprospiraceae bacterium]
MSNKKKNKKKPAAPEQQMSPKNYILTGRARKLPIAECWISPNWEGSGLSTIAVARRHNSGNMTLGIYLLDTFCLGLKNTNVLFNQADYEYEDYLDKIFSPHGGKEPIEYTLAHNIIYGAIAYAEDLGFKPNKDWTLSQMILEEDTEDIELIELEFGKDGKPLFINGPYDNVQKVLNTLNKSVGQGNYDFITQINDGSDFDGFDDDDFDDEYDDEDDDNEDIEDADFEEIKS